MKVFIISLFLLTLSTAINAEEIQSGSVWIDTNTVFISNSQSLDIARRDCETTMRILSVMSNDKIVFRSMCEPAYNARCTYYFCYKMSAKALVVDSYPVE